jgi:hypothetical protein
MPWRRGSDLITGAAASPAPDTAGHEAAAAQHARATIKAYPDPHDPRDQLVASCGIGGPALTIRSTPRLELRSSRSSVLPTTP